MMKNGMVKCAVAMFALAMGVAVQAQGPGPGRGRRGGAMGPGSFMFDGIVGGFGGKVVTGQPFTAQVNIETTQTLSNGIHVDQKITESIARDSAGRTRREIMLSAIGPLASSGETPHLAFIGDPVTGKNYVLNQDKKSVLTMNRRANEEGRWMGKGRENRGENADVQTTSLGTRVIDGLTVEGTRTTRTIPIGKIGNDKPIVITREEWYSPDLQMVVSSTRTDPRFGTTTFQLTNINRNEPLQSLFMVPADYIASPMQMRMKRNAAGPPDER